MKKAGTHKAFGRRTIRFNFLLIYATAGFIAIALIIGGGFITNHVTSGYKYFDQRIDPIKYQLLSINNNISQYTAYQQAFWHTKNPHFEEKLKFLRSKVKSRLSIVAAHADTLNDASFVVKVDLMKSSYDKLLAEGDALNASTAENSEALQVAFLERMEELALMAKLANNYIYEEHQQADYTDVMESLDNVQLYVLMAFLVMVAVFYAIIRKARRFINSELLIVEKEVAELALGNLPNELPDPKNELSTLSQSINTLVRNLHNVKEFSLRVGQNDFDTDITVFNNEGDLGTSLASMRQSLKEVSTEDRRRDWVNTGLTQFLSIIRDYNDKTEELSYQVLSNLVKYVGANQGGIFLVQKDDDNKAKLHLEACFAYDRRKFETKVIEPGQGLVGQAYLEREKIYLKEIPKQYTHITSGLGLATPRTILVQPLVVNDEVMGILELASFEDFAPHVQEFIEKVSESVASALNSAKSATENKRILAQQKDMTEQLQSQEEELRQNTEELLATQEGMERRIRELESENEKLRSGAAVA